MNTEVNRERLYSLFKDMVDIYSPSGKEKQITEYISSYLCEKGLPVTLREVSDGRRNVEVLCGGAAPEIAFIGHIDTVPAFDIEHYEFSSDKEGQISGLGTADMKSGCAAMIEAFVSLNEAGNLPSNAALFLVVGEEENGDGAAAILDAMQFPWAIVAEPTELVPCFSHYGYIEMLAIAYGRRRHASQAGRDQNAIFHLLRMLLRLGGFLESDYPEAVMNIRSVHSSEAGFAVPGSCEAWVDMHIKPSEDANAFKVQLKQLADSCLSSGAVTDYEVDFPTIASGYRISEDGWLSDIIKNAFAEQGLPWCSGTFKSHSDANLLREIGCNPVILGPGSLACAHTREESVDFEQVVSAARMYSEILLKCKK